MSDPDFISGSWTGFFNHNAGGDRHHTDLTLVFVRGIISGEGEDQIGIFGVAGCYDVDTQEVHWTKTYLGGHMVRYKGFADGQRIWGTWEIPGANKGGFHVWPVIGAVVRRVYARPARQGLLGKARR